MVSPAASDVMVKPLRTPGRLVFIVKQSSDRRMTMRVDYSAIKVNQAGLILLLLAAYLLDVPALVAATAVVLALSAASPDLALFGQLYRRVLQPAGLVTPHVIADDPAPHRFSQVLGATVLALSAVALLVANNLVLGWGLAALVVVLAGVNLFFGFCAGCFLYFQLARLRRA
jgi:hypothetical protein